RCLPPSVQGIGGHPMAGAETTGIAGSDRYLFENAVYVLTPPPGVAAASMERLQSLVAATGARVLVMDADTHDVLVAAVSHLPHLVAAELVRVASRQPEALVLAAGGFRDATRIAASNPGMWEDIIFSNREAVLGQLEAMISSLEEVRDVVAAGDRPALRARLEQARAVRESIPRRQKGLLAQLHEVTAIVPDRPGVIGQVGVVLGRQGVNIVDIEILRVREGDGGTLRLAFATPAEAERAVELLRAEGIKSWVR
ncbi:MAG: prephenate dehydrogenase/arogenate dehydrogenase family protein, partial [Syntrophomonadaceae bacterium]|nr:prephenate dehydrogenase/arogenate dehydrogenase family protein [Syntrophomonadaceae bacterium]